MNGSPADSSGVPGRRDFGSAGRNEVARLQMKLVRTLAALAVFTLLLACGARKFPSVPDELVGVWKTSAPQYADRFFELRKSFIVFGTGEASVSVHFIEYVEEAPAGERTLYTISYLDDGKRYRWSFSYDPEHGKVIRLKNQTQMVWTKKEAAN